MTGTLTFETTRAFTARFKDVKALARAGAVVELREGEEVFVFHRKPDSAGFLGALKGKVTHRSPTADLFSTGETWEADK